MGLETDVHYAVRRAQTSGTRPGARTWTSWPAWARPTRCGPSTKSRLGRLQEYDARARRAADPDPGRLLRRRAQPERRRRSASRRTATPSSTACAGSRGWCRLACVTPGWSWSCRWRCASRRRSTAERRPDARRRRRSNSPRRAPSVYRSSAPDSAQTDTPGGAGVRRPTRGQMLAPRRETPLTGGHTFCGMVTPPRHGRSANGGRPDGRTCTSAEAGALGPPAALAAAGDRGQALAAAVRARP